MTEDDKLRTIRDDIPLLKKGIYVDSASVAPVPRRIREASERFNAIVEERLRDAKELAAPVYEKGRILAAKLVGASARNIAYVQNTSHGLSLVALGLDWRPGDNLVVSAQEFPSNYLCWIQLAARGVEIRQVSADDGTLTADHLRGAMDSRTRLVAVSHVQFYSGFRVDLAALGELCSAHGALLVVDGTQSVGAIAVDAGAAGVDVLVASAHKWLMGPRGIGFASFSDRALAQIAPSMVGWLSVNDPFAFNRKLDFLPDARRFEAGTPNGSGMFGLAERLAQIDELGIGWIESRILGLHDALCESAAAHGLEQVYRFAGRERSGIVLLRKPGTDAAALNAMLSQNGVFASVRNGAVRVATHYFNTADEVERIVSIMAG